MLKYKCIDRDITYSCTDPSKCINDHTLRSDTRVVSDFTLKIVRQNPPRSE